MDHPASLLARDIEKHVRGRGESVLDLRVDQHPGNLVRLELGRVGVAFNGGRIPHHGDLAVGASPDPREHARPRELEPGHAWRIERHGLGPARRQAGVGSRGTTDEIDVVTVGEHDVDVVRLVHAHDREPVAHGQLAGSVEDEARVERVRREHRGVHRADRNVRRTGLSEFRRAPDVEIVLVPAHECPDHRSVGLEDVVSAHVVGDAGRGILNEGSLRPRGTAVVRLRHIDVMLAKLELGCLPKGHVDCLLSPREIPLPVELRRREGERGPVLAFVRGHRHRAGTQPEARAVDAPR